MKEPTLIDRITRLESRLVVGFEQLGVDVKRRTHNVEIDHDRRVITAPKGVSLKAIVDKLPKYQDVAYRVDIDGYPVCMIGAYSEF